MRVYFVVILLVLPLIFIGSGIAYSQGVSSTPERTPENLLVAFYNIKWLGQTPHDLSKLSDVIENFDVCVVLEIKKASELERLWTTLNNQTGFEWGYVIGPRTHRPRGSYHESYAYLYRKDRVQLGNGFTSNIFDRGEAFRNDPMLATFDSEIGKFTLLAVHTRWTDDRDGTRAGEVKAIPGQIRYLRERLGVKNIIVGGDFNYTGEEDILINSMRKAKLVHVDVDDKTTFKTNGSGYNKDYDHIFVSKTVKEMVVGKARALDATNIIYGNNSEASMKRSQKELSDHLPVFVELSDSSDDDIRGGEIDVE